MRRTLAALLVPAAAVCAAWLATEDPRRIGQGVAVSVLALLPALLRDRRLRVSALLVTACGVGWLAVGHVAWDVHRSGGEGFPRGIVDVLSVGVGDFAGVVLPFDPGRHSEMHALVLLAIYVFTAAAALLVAANRPALAAAAVVTAIGWPATLLDAGAAAAGVLALVACLWIFLVARARSLVGLATGAAVAAVVVGGAAWASSAASFAREAAVSWEAWDFRGLPAKAVGVRFVWTASYDGITFPRTKTTVLEITGPKRPHYWRVSTLDHFTADRWFEDLVPVSTSEADGQVPAEALAGPAVRRGSTPLEQEVTVKALVDDRIAAAGTPVRLNAPDVGTVTYFSGGIVRAARPLEPRTRYRVWSVVPEPSPATLAATPARYPRALTRFLTVWGRALPPFGEPGREERVRVQLRDPSWAAVAQYRPLYEVALRVTREAPTPYEAVLALESWLRRTGGFRYDQQPPRADDLPPLVDFVTSTRAGYCQHFAGAMALMLRFLGVPARVALGFTSGTWDGRRWRVTDHDAHAWVEVWFPGQGWVAFDPTPGRGTLAGIYSFASENARAVAVLSQGVRADRPPPGSISASRAAADRPARVEDSSLQPGAPILGFVLLSVGLWLVGLWAVKLVVRRLRRFTDDPRLSAGASRREFEAFLRDQGVQIPANATLAWLQGAARARLGIDIRAFVSAVARARFGPAESAARDSERARQELRAVLRQARSRLSLVDRARGLLSLRSLRGDLRS